MPDNTPTYRIAIFITAPNGMEIHQAINVREQQICQSGSTLLDELYNRITCNIISAIDQQPIPTDIEF